MDINSLLPLLMAQRGGQKNQNAALAELLKASAANPGNTQPGMEAVLAQMLQKNNPAPNQSAPISQADLLATLLKAQQGGQPPNDMAALLAKMMQSSPAPAVHGFDPIAGIVNNEILGKMTKYYLNPTHKPKKR